MSVHIERLVLKDFRREDRDAIAAGLEQELTRVLADRASLERLTARGGRPRLRTDMLHIGDGAHPAIVGSEIARAIGKGVKP